MCAVPAPAIKLSCRTATRLSRNWNRVYARYTRIPSQIRPTPESKSCQQLSCSLKMAVQLQLLCGGRKTLALALRSSASDLAPFG